MIDCNAADAPQNNGEWIRPSPMKEKAGNIAAWVMVIIATIFIVVGGIFICAEGGKVSHHIVVFFLIPTVFWFMLLEKNEPPIRSVRIVHGHALQVEIENGVIVTITYEKLADMTPFAKKRLARRAGAVTP